MPCNSYQGGDTGRTKYITTTEYVYHPTPEQQMEHAMTKSQNRNLTAMLCALFNDLKNRGILEDVLKTASSDGKIDFSSFIEKHEAEDTERMKDYLLKMSKHERKLLLDILKKEFSNK